VRGARRGAARARAQWRKLSSSPPFRPRSGPAA
jgi:hypothetical protein